MFVCFFVCFFCGVIAEVEITGGHQSISMHIAEMTAHNSSGVDIVSRHIL